MCVIRSLNNVNVNSTAVTALHRYESVISAKCLRLRLTMSDSHLYTRLLLPKRHGYPLSCPAPYGDAPLEARWAGIEIGDVGVIMPDGSFDVIFSICRSSYDPANRFGVPRGFERIHLGPEDIASRPEYHDPGSHVSNTTINKRRLGVDAGTESNVQVCLCVSSTASHSTASDSSRWAQEQL
jgi:hypothetical protein